jgi:hypothetical protein
MNLYREIISILEQLAQEKKEVKLINSHKGIPISYGATIQGFNTSGVIFQVHKYQVVCLELERQTFLYTDLLPSVVKAKVANIDIITGKVTLTGFVYAVESIGKRMMLRVEPDQPISVVISNDKRRLRGNLADISEKGIGLYVQASQTITTSVFIRHSKVLINLRLPTEPSEISLDGIISHIRKDGQAYHLGINIAPDPIIKGAITSFISQRQMEILCELQILYDQLLQENLKQPKS